MTVIPEVMSKSRTRNKIWEALMVCCPCFESSRTQMMRRNAVLCQICMTVVPEAIYKSRTTFKLREAFMVCCTCFESSRAQVIKRKAVLCQICMTVVPEVVSNTRENTMIWLNSTASFPNISTNGVQIESRRLCFPRYIHPFHRRDFKKLCPSVNY